MSRVGGDNDGGWLAVRGVMVELDTIVRVVAAVTQPTVWMGEG